MTIKNYFTPSRIYRIAVVISLAILISVSVVFHYQMKNLNRTADRIYASNKRQYLLEKIFSEISQRETSLRNYLITEDEKFIENDIQIKRNILDNLEDLEKNYGEDSLKYSEFEQMQTAVENFLNGFESIRIQFKNNSLTQNQLNDILTARANDADNIRSAVFILVEKEVAKHKIHGINHRYDTETSTTTAFVLTVIVMVILLVSLYRINNSFVKTKKLNQELNFLNEVSDKAEIVANISHWKINMKTGKYFYSDNFYRIMGLQPGDFNDAASFQKFMHPDDAEEVIKAHEESLKNQTPTNFVYRIIRKDGEIRYLKSTGDFTRNAKGELVKIGVTNDITNVYHYQNQLEETNKTLTEANTELESFNQIVSHDLQEPLRKIQMFTSRIEDTESQNISEKGLEYFSKIKNSAKRMQTLMIDLVNYSRTVKDAKTFVNTDINQVIEDVKQELALNIDETKAVISAEKLPEINAIPFQIHQLFVNLISNSLKYSKENVTPEIKIYSEKIQVNETVSGNVLKSSDYIKIVVSDNGIGFQQEFSEKIFQLFKRLETELDYSGTGLGLSICRKIVENHKGYILAEGQPNVGAKFYIYLKK